MDEKRVTWIAKLKNIRNRSNSKIYSKDEGLFTIYREIARKHATRDICCITTAELNNAII